MKRSAKDEAAKGNENAAKAAAKGKAVTVNVPEGKGAAKASSAKARVAKDNKVKANDSTAKATERRGNAAKAKAKAASGSAAKERIKANKTTEYFEYQNGDKVIYLCGNRKCKDPEEYYKNPFGITTHKSPPEIIPNKSCSHCGYKGEMTLFTDEKQLWFYRYYKYNR